MCPAPVTDANPRGFIIPIGGGEDRVKEMQILRKFVELSGGAGADIVVISTASQLERTGLDYNEIFRELGAGKVECLPITNRADCDNPEFAEILDRTTGIFMTGGSSRPPPCGQCRPKSTQSPASVGPLSRPCTPLRRTEDRRPTCLFAIPSLGDQIC